MKKIVILIVSMVFMLAAMGVMAGEQHQVSGVIKSIDSAKKKITVSHGPIKTLGMMGMTMAFGVYDPSMIGEVKAGNKIDFVVEVDKVGAFTIMEMEIAD